MGSIYLYSIMKTHTILSVSFLLFGLVLFSQTTAKNINHNFELEDSEAKNVLSRTRRGWSSFIFGGGSEEEDKDSDDDKKQTDDDNDERDDDNDEKGKSKGLKWLQL